MLEQELDDSLVTEATAEFRNFQLIPQRRLSQFHLRLREVDPGFWTGG